jgi:hypothetical protein
MVVRRWRKEVEGRSVWAAVLKKALVTLQGPQASESIAGGTDLSLVQKSSLKISTLTCCRVFRRTSFETR